MKCVCLIPTINRPSLINSKVSALHDGWKVITQNGYNNVNIAREILFEKAINSNADIIRYCDDDDLILPHKQEILSEISNCDIIYTNILICNKNITKGFKLTGNPYKDKYNIFPVSWIARTESLLKIKEKFDYLWNPEIQCREGGWIWYNFLQSNLKIKHLAIYSYLYNQSDNGLHKHPDFEKQSKLLHEAYDLNGTE